MNTRTREHLSQVIRCEAILFDLDGVLIDSIENVEYHWRRWAEEQGLDGDEVMAVVHGVRAVEAIRTLAPHLDAEQEAIRLAEREATDTRGIRTVDGARELLASCPDGRWAIVTSGTENVARARMQCTELPAPPLLVTADDVTKGKPDPTPYLTAARQLDVKAKRCIVVEDTPSGVDSGLAAGMQVIAVTSSHDKEEVLHADAIIDRLSRIRIAPGELDGTGLVIKIEDE